MANLKTQMWEGLQQYAISGHNTGKAPCGYAEQRATHPSPIKAKIWEPPAPGSSLTRLPPCG